MEARRSTTEKPSENLVSKLEGVEVPPKDSKNVGNQKNEADEGREAVCVSLLLDRVALNQVPEARPNYHA